MAKVKYNPLNAFREDPLAALKQATDRPESKQADSTLIAPAESNVQATTASDQPENNLNGREPALREPSSRAAMKPLSATLNTSRNTVYLYPEDLTKLRQLSGYVSSEHGIRANDSMIFRAALALLEPDARLLHALRETEMLDRRRKGRSSLP